MSLSPPIRVYIVAVVAAAAAVTAFLYTQETTPLTVVGVLSFGMLVFMSENFYVKLPKAGTVSVAFTIIMAAAIVYGPRAAAISACFGAVAYRDVRDRIPPYRWVFNGAQYALSAAVAGQFYVWSGGLVLSGVQRPFVLTDFPVQLLPIAVFAGTFFAVNSIVVAGVIALHQRVPFQNVWFTNVQGIMYNYLAFTPLAIALADTYMRASYLGLLLMALPLLVARQTFQIYMNLREAYWGTVKSLIAALEAKDRYTSGHSQRVADLAEKIGRKMRLDEKDMTLLHYAATLHDIGKIGTARSILKKPGKLTEEEYHRMRLHPESGALIIQEIEFLKEVVPIVFHHHERVDGTGYGDGLAGDEIPLLARILAVADAYDAMTSPRPYRQLLSSEEACEEVRRCVGSQFDARVVATLVDIVSSEDSREDDSADRTQEVTGEPR